MAQAIRIIQEEHRRLAAVLNCIDGLLGESERQGGGMDFALLHASIDYLRSFLYRFHHPKENEHLFRALRTAAADTAPVLDELERQHRQGAHLIDALDAALTAFESGQEDGRGRFRQAFDDYHAFEWRHMKQEEDEVLPRARAVVPEAEWSEIDAAFRSHDDPLFGDAQKAHFRALFSAIARRAPAPFGLSDGRPA